MKKQIAEFAFTFAPIVPGLKGGEYVPIEANDARLVKRVKAKLSLNSMPETGEDVTLLTEEQISTVFEEECCGLFDRLEDVEAAFTFTPRRHRGWREEDGTFHSHRVWISLLSDQGIRRVEDAVTESGYVLSQLVRFGIMDKLRLVPAKAR